MHELDGTDKEERDGVILALEEEEKSEIEREREQKRWSDELYIIQ